MALLLLIVFYSYLKLNNRILTALYFIVLVLDLGCEQFDLILKIRDLVTAFLKVLQLFLLAKEIFLKIAIAFLEVIEFSLLLCQ